MKAPGATLPRLSTGSTSTVLQAKKSFQKVKRKSIPSLSGQGPLNESNSKGPPTGSILFHNFFEISGNSHTQNTQVHSFSCFFEIFSGFDISVKGLGPLGLKFVNTYRLILKSSEP
jgi:hypothetical protein